jgi:hypothetical protein
LNKAGDEADDTGRRGRIVIDCFLNRELAIKRVATAPVTGNRQSWMSRRLERPALSVGIIAGHEWNTKALGTEEEIPPVRIAWLEIMHLEVVHLASRGVGVSGKCAGGRGVVVGLSLADIVAGLALHGELASGLSSNGPGDSQQGERQCEEEGEDQTGTHDYAFLVR